MGPHIFYTTGDSKVQEFDGNGKKENLIVFYKWKRKSFFLKLIKYPCEFCNEFMESRFSKVE